MEGNNIKQFVIIDSNNGSYLRTISAQNGKRALEKFRHSLMCANRYDLHKVAGRWVLASQHGAHFVAKETQESCMNRGYFVGKAAALA